MKRPLWQTLGSEPDYRFSLANERTFLAWIRTALAFLGTGLVLTQLSSHFDQPFVVRGAGLSLIFVGFLISSNSYTRWKANEIALRHAQPLPPFAAMSITAGAMLLICSFFIVYIIGGTLIA